MRKYENQTIETRVEISCTCDKCGEEIKTDYYDAFDFDFKLKTGFSYPEGGSGEKIILDLCKECAKMLVSFLQDNGFKTRTEDWDF